MLVDDKLAPLDPEIVETLRSLDNFKGTFLNELIDLFIGDARPVLLRLNISMEVNSVALTKRMAHKMKGMAANLGAQRFVRVLQHIENSFEDFSAEERAEIPKVLERELERAIEALLGVRVGGIRATA